MKLKQYQIKFQITRLRLNYNDSYGFVSYKILVKIHSKLFCICNSKIRKFIALGRLRKEFPKFMVCEQVQQFRDAFFLYFKLRHFSVM